MKPKSGKNVPKKRSEKVFKKMPKRVRKGSKIGLKIDTQMWKKKQKNEKIYFFKIPKMDFQFLSGRKLAQNLAPETEKYVKVQKH